MFFLKKCRVQQEEGKEGADQVRQGRDCAAERPVQEPHGACADGRAAEQRFAAAREAEAGRHPTDHEGQAPQGRRAECEFPL